MKILFLSRSTLFTQPGGDTVQIRETALALNELGLEVIIHLKGDKINFENFDLVHFFNLGRPADLLPYLPKITVPIIVSSIYVEYGSSLLANFKEYAKTIARWINRSDSYPGALFLYIGQKKGIQLILDRAKTVISSTPTEKKRIEHKWNYKNKFEVISLGLNKNYITQQPIQERKGIIMVGRIEKLKNQLIGIQAAEQLMQPLKVIGNAAANQPQYYKQCQLEAKKHTMFTPFLEQDELIKEYQNAEILVLPSHFETFGLVALEAWSQGCKLVLSDKIESKDFFSDKALFFNPTDIEDLKAKIETSIALPNKQPEKSELERYSWRIAAQKLQEIYKTSIS